MNSSDDIDTETSNPSVVVHVLHESQDCILKGQSCEEIILYSRSSTPRCADQEISVDITEGQECKLHIQLRL